MKKIEIISPIDLPKECKDSVIITRYPWWMKWVIKFVEVYVVPNTWDCRMVWSTFACYENYDKLNVPQGRISEIA